MNYSPTMESNSNSIVKISSPSSQPLFSTIVTLYTLILLYAPSFFLTILLSPTLNSTGIILLFLLKLGAKEGSRKESCCQEESRSLDSCGKDRLEKDWDYELCEIFEHDLRMESNSQDGCYKWELVDTYSMESSQVVGKEETRMEMNSKDTILDFVIWDLKAPLEIIYEGEEEQEDDNENDMHANEKSVSGFDEYVLTCHLESEIESSSDDSDFLMSKHSKMHESVFVKWEKEDDDREELIEISLDRYEEKSIRHCHDEEDNMIEINIFPT